QHHAEAAALANHGAGLDAGAVVVHEALGDGQAEPSPLPGRLGREERIEDPAEILGRNARALVLQLDLDLTARVTRSDDQGAAALHRLESIRGQPETDLTELALVHYRRRKLGIELGYHPAPREAGLVGQELRGLQHDAVQIRRGPLAAGIADELQEIAGDLFAAIRLFLDEAQVLAKVRRLGEPGRIALVQPSAERFGAPGDRRHP